MNYKKNYPSYPTFTSNKESRRAYYKQEYNNNV